MIFSADRFFHLFNVSRSRKRVDSGCRGYKKEQTERNMREESVYLFQTVSLYLHKTEVGPESEEWTQRRSASITLNKLSIDNKNASPYRLTLRNCKQPTSERSSFGYFFILGWYVLFKSWRCLLVIKSLQTLQIFLIKETSKAWMQGVF